MNNYKFYFTKNSETREDNIEADSFVLALEELHIKYGEVDIIDFKKEKATVETVA